MSFSAQDLPYNSDHLSPVLSKETIDFHFGKHQQAYADKLETLTNSTSYENMDLIAIIKETFFDNTKTAIFNNAAQLWNHVFYWAALKSPASKTVFPQGDFALAVNESFGGWDKLNEQLSEAAISIFGSGWAWLVLNPKTRLLEIVKTQNAGNPVTYDLIPLFTIDVWEHAYYIDYRNKRADYVKALLTDLADWNVVAERYDEAMQKLKP